MDIESLKKLGLAQNETRVYGALLDLKEATIGEISLDTKIHRRNVSDTLKRLIDRGLVFPVLVDGDKLYSPVDPDKFTDLINEKQAILDKILPELKTRYERRNINQEAYIYRGIEGIKNYMRDVLRIGEDLFVIGAKLGWLDLNLGSFFENFLKEAKRKAIKLHVLYDADIKNLKKEAESHFGKDYTFLPKGFSTNSSISVFGDYVVTYTGIGFKKINEDVVIFVLRDKSLAESYRTWFKLLIFLLKSRNK